MERTSTVTMHIRTPHPPQIPHNASQSLFLTQYPQDHRRPQHTCKTPYSPDLHRPRRPSQNPTRKISSGLSPQPKSLFARHPPARHPSQTPYPQDLLQYATPTKTPIRRTSELPDTTAKKPETLAKPSTPATSATPAQRTALVPRVRFYCAVRTVDTTSIVTEAIPSPYI